MLIAGIKAPPGTIRRGFLETHGFADGVRVRMPIVVAAGARGDRPWPSSPASTAAN
jgi:hypothetical protein